MRQTTESDSQLIQSFLKGDVSGVEKLFKRYQNKIYTYIFFLVKKEDIAEDIFQDTFLKVYHSLKKGKYKDDGRFVSWATRIAHNLVIDYFREQTKTKMISGHAQEDIVYFENSEKNVESQIINQQIHDDIKKLIDYLPEDQREVVIMRNYMDMSFKEIADISGVSINTALGRMRYAIINLRKLIKEHNIIVQQ
ncbi:MAG: sigma-70 family RNA polymerase sigma factor [Bacteroidales bacterium]|nr:sigma-70 family RNA polymerase sigma factor [Bacteroidales bacterium]